MNIYKTAKLIDIKRLIFPKKKSIFLLNTSVVFGLLFVQLHSLALHLETRSPLIVLAFLNAEDKQENLK